MLKGISPLISPELLKVLSEMGHGDELILCDAHFPTMSHNKRIIRADGIQITSLLTAILPLIELDWYVEHPVVMMAPVKGDILDENVEKAYLNEFNKFVNKTFKIERISRESFYERATKAFALVATGDTAQYANIILKKGVILT